MDGTVTDTHSIAGHIYATMQQGLETANTILPELEGVLSPGKIRKRNGKNKARGKEKEGSDSTKENSGRASRKKRKKKKKNKKKNKKRERNKKEKDKASEDLGSFIEKLRLHEGTAVDGVVMGRDESYLGALEVTFHPYALRITLPVRTVVCAYIYRFICA